MGKVDALLQAGDEFLEVTECAAPLDSPPDLAGEIHAVHVRRYVSPHLAELDTTDLLAFATFMCDRADAHCASGLRWKLVDRFCTAAESPTGEAEKADAGLPEELARQPPNRKGDVLAPERENSSDAVDDSFSAELAESLVFLPPKVQGLSACALHERIQSGLKVALLLDVRTKILFELEHIRGALSFEAACERDNTSFISASPETFSGTDTLLRSCLTLSDRGDVEVIVYDHAAPSTDASYSRGMQIASVLLSYPQVSAVWLLEGGFSKFSALYPEDCIVSQPSARSSACLQRALKSKLGSKLYKRIIEKQLKSSLQTPSIPPSQILPYLYIGCQRDATSLEGLRALGVTHVLIVGEELKAHFSDDDFVYKKLSLKDAIDEPISDSFAEACQFLDSVRRTKGSCVLVHCYAGVSRSVAITIAYLIYLNYTLRAAYELVRERRTIIAPNSGFMETLAVFEISQLGLSTRHELAMGLENDARS